MTRSQVQFVHSHGFTVPGDMTMVTAIYSSTGSDVFLRMRPRVALPLLTFPTCSSNWKREHILLIVSDMSAQMDKFRFTEFLLELEVEGAEEMLIQHVSKMFLVFPLFPAFPDI